MPERDSVREVEERGGHNQQVFQSENSHDIELERRDADFINEWLKHDVRIEFSFYESEPDGDVRPFVDAVSFALSKMLPKYLHAVHCFGSKTIKADKYAAKMVGTETVPNDPKPDSRAKGDETGVNEVSSEHLFRTVDELELSVRAAKGIEAAKIRTVVDLVQRTESDMLKIKHFGKVSLKEVKAVLGELGLSFGMRLDPGVLERLRVMHEHSFGSN